MVETFFAKDSDALLAGEWVELRGLCSFFVKHYKAYTGRNPKTGDKVVVPAKRLPFFKAGLEFLTLCCRLNSFVIWYFIMSFISPANSTAKIPISGQQSRFIQFLAVLKFPMKIPDHDI